jgi:hypothetical protein
MDATENNSASGTERCNTVDIKMGRLKAAATGIGLSQNRSKWRTVMNCTEPAGAINCRKFIDPFTCTALFQIPTTPFCIITK